jgi:hypothetical protein
MLQSRKSLIGDLEQALASGSSDRRLELLNRITGLFLEQGGNVGSDLVDVFDEVLQRLASGIETCARARLAETVASVANAPMKLVSDLAHDEAIEVARPILEHAEYLDDLLLVDCASTLGQSHLLAISRRRTLSKNVTEVLVERGDSEVLRSVAGNKGARFSENGFKALICHAQQDDLLATTIGLRRDLPEPCFCRLLQRASHQVRQKLLEAYPDRAALIGDVVDKIKVEIAPERDYSSAIRLIDNLKLNNELNDDTLTFLAKSKKYEEVVVALAAMSDLTIRIIEEAMASTSADPVLIIAKAASLSWPAAQAVLALQARRPLAQHTLDVYRATYHGLSVRAAQRVTRFYKVRRVLAGVPRQDSISLGQDASGHDKVS